MLGLVGELVSNRSKVAIMLARMARSAVSPRPNITHNPGNKSFETGYFEDDRIELCRTILEYSHLYYVPIIILLGLIGNLLSCVVFLNTHLRMRSSSYYLAALATTDFSFLVTLLLVWLNNTFGWEVFNKDGWCEMVTYVGNVCSSLSVWLIVAFTVERFIAVQYPLHRPHMCTIARAKTIVLILTILAMICHSYSFITAGVTKHPEAGDMCLMKKEWTEVMRIVSIVDSIASLIAPIILIVVMNAMITRNLLKFSRRFRPTPEICLTQFPSRERSEINLHQMQISRLGEFVESCPNIRGSTSINSNPNDNPSNSDCTDKRQPSFLFSRGNRSFQCRCPTQTSISPRNVYQVTDGSKRCTHLRTSTRNRVSSNQQRNQQSITKMLLLISTVFILLNLPSYVIRLCVFFFTLARKDAPNMLWCLQQFCMLLYYTHFSINFLLYAMCGITFRRCLEQLLRKVFKNITKYHCNPQRYI